MSTRRKPAASGPVAPRKRTRHHDGEEIEEEPEISVAEETNKSNTAPKRKKKDTEIDDEGETGEEDAEDAENAKDAKDATEPKVEPVAKKVVTVDYMAHASKKTKDRRATSTARKEQISIEQQMQMSKDMRAMVNAESNQDQQESKSVAVNESLLPFVIEESSSAPSGNDTTDAETQQNDRDDGAEDNSEAIVTDNPAEYFRKRFAGDAKAKQDLQMRKEKRDQFLSTNPKFLSARVVREPSPEPVADAAFDEDDDKDDKINVETTKKPSVPDILYTREKEEQEERGNAAGEAVVRVTGSDQIKKRDYSIYVDHRFKDAGFEADKLSEEQLVKQLISSLASRENLTLEQAEEALKSRGYGKRALTIESFDLRQQTYGKSNYPTSTRVRCRYDHHPFRGIPVLLPIKYYEKSNLLTVFPNICFCSFSCALAFLEREAPSTMRRRDRVQMLHFMARKFFGLSDHIRPAPFLEQHIDYGGRLTTEQFRALATTHCSFIQYPLAISVPCTIVTEITVLQKLDRNLMASIAKRTEEEHEKAIPEKPEYGQDDAQGAYKRDQKEGKGRPLKRRTLKDDTGNMVTLDKTFLDNAVKSSRSAAQSAGSKPVGIQGEAAKTSVAAPTGIQALMGIKTVTKTLKQ